MPGMTPEEILQIHKDYADQFASLAQSGLSGAFSALSASGLFDYYPAGINITMPDVGEPKEPAEFPNLPGDPTLPTLGDLKDFVDIPNTLDGSDEHGLFEPGSGPPPNQFSNGVGSLEAPPEYTAPTKPSAIGEFTDQPPEDPTLPPLPTTPTYLTMPALLLPYETINLPTNAPVLTNPVFEGQRPTPITAPTPEYLVTQYRTEKESERAFIPTYVRDHADTLISMFAPDYPEIRSRINQAIIDYTDPIDGGGVSIPDNVAASIMARHNDRAMQEYQKALDSTAETLSTRGFTIPPGALLDAVRQARTAMGDSVTRGSSELAGKTLELEQQNFQFMLKLGEALEEKMLETVTQYLRLSLDMNGQAIASAKEILAAYLGAYNIQVLVYKALYDGYQTDAEVFKARIAANESLVRLYETEIRAELAKTEVNNAYVNILRAAADANLAIANSYKVQVDAAMAPLEIARLEVAIFEARVRAYGAEVAAYEARWRGYVAEVEGELGAFKAYEAQAAGFVAQVQAYKAKLEAEVAKITAAAETNRAVGQHNESVVRVYSAQADSAIKVYEGQLAGYATGTNAILKQSDIEVEYWRTKANLIFQEFNVAVQQTFEYAREQMNLFRGQMEAGINAANGLAHASQVAGNLAGQAMSGLTSFAGTLESSSR